MTNTSYKGKYFDFKLKEEQEQQQRQDNNDINQREIKFGELYESTRKHSKFDVGEDPVVVPLEIEIDSMLYNLVDNVILRHIDPAEDKMSFEEWVNICFKERMNQILTDSEEFGKLLLNPIRKANCLPKVEIE